jgi:hypothetical protein
MLGVKERTEVPVVQRKAQHGNERQRPREKKGKEL